MFIIIDLLFAICILVAAIQIAIGVCQIIYGLIMLPLCGALYLVGAVGEIVLDLLGIE